MSSPISPRVHEAPLLRCATVIEIRPLRLGPLTLASPCVQAGLAGYSDQPMRMVARRRGCPFAITEALSDEHVVGASHRVREVFRVADGDHPLAGQLMGCDPATMGKAAGVLADAGHDVIDVNIACPVRRQARPRGGHLLADVPRAIAVLRSVRDAVPAHVPTTVKLRRGTDMSDEAAERFHLILDAAFDAGYAAACVHGRTVQQGYVGPSDWEFLSSLRRRHPHRTLLGSGDVFTAASAVRMLVSIGLDGVWIARGAIGDPWIFERVRRLLAQDTKALEAAPDLETQRLAMEEHLDLGVAMYGPRRAAIRMRAVAMRYSRWHPQAVPVRAAFLEARTVEDFRATLRDCYEGGGPGVWPDERAVDEVNTSG